MLPAFNFENLESPVVVSNAVMRNSRQITITLMQIKIVLNGSAPRMEISKVVLTKTLRFSDVFRR